MLLQGVDRAIDCSGVASARHAALACTRRWGSYRYILFFPMHELPNRSLPGPPSMQAKSPLSVKVAPCSLKSPQFLSTSNSSCTAGRSTLPWQKFSTVLRSIGLHFALPFYLSSFLRHRLTFCPPFTSFFLFASPVHVFARLFPLSSSLRHRLTLRPPLASIQSGPQNSWVTSIPNMVAVAELLSKHDLHPEIIVSHRFALEQGAEAYATADKGECGKVVIVME